MLQAAPTLAGRSFSIQDDSGRPVIVSVGEDGFLSQQAETAVTRDGDGNLVRLIEVAHPNVGEPTLQYFAFPELMDVPDAYRAVAVEVDGEKVVPARYVRGVHGERIMVDLDPDLEERILAHQATLGLIRRVPDSEDSVPDEEAVEEDE